MRLLTLDAFNSAASIFTKYQEGVSFPAPFSDMLTDAMKSGSIKICLTEDDDSIPNGFGIIGVISGQVHAIWVDDGNTGLNRESINMLEKEISDWCFREINCPPARIDFPKMTENLKNEFLLRGYREYKRASMSVSRDDFMENREISLPAGFAIAPYQPDLRDNVADVIAEANRNHVDAIIYPEFFSSKEKALGLLRKLEENEIGEYVEGGSQVLLKGGDVIGACIIVKRDVNASIPDMVIAPPYQGKGLGKALLMNTILSFLRSDESLKAISLAVTLSNPARYLYEKLGFRIKDEFSAIVYSRNDVTIK